MEKREIYKPKYFKPYELLPPEVYTHKVYNSEEEAYKVLNELMDYEFLVTMDAVREILGVPLIVNTWYQGGNRKYCGYRPQNCSVGVAKSQHKLGKAADCVSNKMTASQMWEKLDADKDKLPYPIRVEKGAAITWLHCDNKDMDYKGQKIYYFQG